MKIKIIFKIFLVLAVIFILGGVKNSYAQKKIDIEIVVYGKIDKEVIEHIKTNLRDFLGISVSISPPEMLPFAAFNADRKQYESLAIIKEVSEKKKDTNKKILVIIDEDLYSSELKFVFGDADKTSGVAIISLIRLREPYYGFPENKKLFFWRSVKEAIHSIGHLYGFDNCSNPLCVMYFSNCLSDIDKKDYEFCDECLKKRQL
ncbi:MAG: archaemetzincin family Zn-dependent metalloprotease [Candidatus Omnitrophica bacterium]|nr:archaemetzincin family Zn-dependent metalloprotease [Candidatus Omnitrophota bacterium]MCK5393284.1 archaemetzincin family Zn-dependent metalloprotease [Candidatus Omnitrophota bacterium]MCK5493321.1 archaemetzincin family Zn-dependent metalloprotease [Candidatus Omnitrophota bacterium]